MLGFNKSLEAGEARLPETSILVEPGIDRFQGTSVQLVKPVPTLTALLHEMGTSQQAQVFRDGRTGDGKGLGDPSGRQASLPQQVEHCATGGIGEGVKGSLRGICNQPVTHNA